MKEVDGAETSEWKTSRLPGPKEAALGSTWKGTATPSLESFSERIGIAPRRLGKSSSKESAWRPSFET